MIDLFAFFSLSKKQRVSCEQHLEVTNALKKLKNSQLEKLDDAYIILMPMFDIVKWNLT